MYYMSPWSRLLNSSDIHYVTFYLEVTTNTPLFTALYDKNMRQLLYRRPSDVSLQYGNAKKSPEV